MINNVANKLKASWNSMIRHPKAFVLVTIFISAVFSLFYLAPAHAQSQQQVQGWFISIFINIMLAITRFALQIMTFILTFIIEIAAYNGYLSSDAVSVGWIMVRDLTNMVFVVALLMIAFGTILGVENYEWKSMLFKLVSAAILVNFSRIIAGVIIDAAQVVMITFVNGIAATVGGNFIQAFDLTRLQSFSQTTTGEINSTAVFIAALASMFIAITVAATTAVMLFMLIARVILLWVLVVLSPIAFSLSVLPKTQAYAKQWWDEFGKQVLTGPILVFFLWLTLVAVGNGTVSQHFYDYSTAPNRISASNDALNANNAGIGQATSWSNLVNFAIAIGFLVVGIKVTQQMGGYGAEWTGKALDFGKRWTSRLSGFSAARAGAQKGAELAKAGGKAIGLAAGKQAYDRLGGAQLNARYNQFKTFMEHRRIAAIKRANVVGEAAYETNDDGTYKRGKWSRFWARQRLKTMVGGADVFRDRAEKAQKEFESTQETRKEHTVSSNKFDFGKRATFAKANLLKHEQHGGEIQAGRAAAAGAHIDMALVALDEKIKMGSIPGLAEALKKKNLGDAVEAIKSDADTMDRLRAEGFSRDEQIFQLVDNYGRSKKGADEKAEGELYGRESRSFDELRVAQAAEELGGSDEGKRRSWQAAEREARTKHIQEKSANQKDLTSIRAIDAYLESPEGKINQATAALLRAQRDTIDERVKRRAERVKLDQEKRTALYGERAETEYQMTEEITPDRNKAVAAAKDTVLKGRGLAPRHTLANAVANQRRIIAQFSDRTWKETVAMTVDSAKKAKAANTPGADQGEMKKRSQAVIDAILACYTKGAEAVLDGIPQAAAAAGFHETVRAGDADGRNRAAFSAMLGGYVKKGQAEEALAKLEGMHGKETMDMVKRMMDEGYTSIASEMAPAYAAQFNGEELNDELTTKWKLETDKGKITGAQDYRADMVDPRRVKTLTGMVTADYTEGGAEVTKSVDQIDLQSLKNFLIFSSKVRPATPISRVLGKQWAKMDDKVRNLLMQAASGGLGQFVGKKIGGVEITADDIKGFEEGDADAAKLLKDKLELKKSTKAEKKAKTEKPEKTTTKPAETQKDTGTTKPAEKTEAKEKKSEPEEKQKTSVLYDAYDRPVSGPASPVHKEFNDRLYREEMLKLQKATKKSMDETKKSIDDLSRTIKTKMGDQETASDTQYPKDPDEDDDENEDKK